MNKTILIASITINILLLIILLSIYLISTGKTNTIFNNALKQVNILPNKTSSINLDDYDISRGTPCQTNSDCTNLPGGGFAAATCYRNHCISCGWMDVMCAQGYHGCEVPITQKYPDWPTSCRKPLTCCPD